MTGTRQRESAVDRIRERVEEKAARRRGRGEGRPPSARAAIPTRRRRARRAPQELPGHPRREAHRRSRGAGWKQILKRAWAENKADNMPIIGGGVAFFGFLAIFPALIAMISLYGLVASPETVARQVENLSAQLPSDALGPHRGAAERRSSTTAAARSPSAWSSRSSPRCGARRAASAT